MGQAKQRGSREDRAAQAVQAQLEQSPINIPCRTCGAILNDFTVLDSKTAGTAWQKKCECGATTTTLVAARHASQSQVAAYAKELQQREEVGGKKGRTSVLEIPKSDKTVANA